MELLSKDRTFVNERRGGYTLLELLLALALSVVLLVAVGAAIDLYRRMTTAGQEDLSEARLVRAVLRRIETDLRCVVPPQPPASSSGSSSGSSSSSSGGSPSGGGGGVGRGSGVGRGGSVGRSSGRIGSGGGVGSSRSSVGTSSSSSSSSSNSSTSTTDDSSTDSSSSSDPLANLYTRSVFGMYGDQQTIVINALCAHPMAAPSTQNAGPTQPLITGIQSDMKTIAYFLTGNGMSGSSLIMTAAPVPQTNAAGILVNSGLARLEGDRLAIGYAMENGSTALAPKIVAPEVVGLAFRYFDGTTWQTTWDGTTTQTLPQAVEVTLAVLPANAPRPGTSSPMATAAGATSLMGAGYATGSQNPMRFYRHVVPILSAFGTSSIPATTTGTTTSGTSTSSSTGQ